MAKNLVTWLEEEEIKVDVLDTSFSWAPTSSPVVKEAVAWTDLSWLEKAKGFEEKQVWIEGINLTPLEVDEPSLETDGLGVPKIDTIEDTPPIQAIEVKTDTEEEISSPDTTITVVDTELEKLRQEKKEKIETTYDSFNLAKWEFEKNKGFYTNFDDTNTTFEWVLSDLRATQQSTWGADLTDEQLQWIANKYWVTLEDVKNPTNIFNKLEFTDEGREKFWVDKAEDKINQLTTDFERSKENLAFNLEWQVIKNSNQLNDVRDQLSKNVAWATASWVWSGWMRSSGYEQGIQNIKDDWQKTIERLKTSLDRVQSADTTNIKRLTEDYEKANEQAKKNLDTQLESLKFDTWLQLSWLEEKYGIGSKELTKKLDAINEEFWTKSLDVFNKYISGMRSIQTMTNENILQQEKINDLVENKANKRYNELIANKWQLLSNISINGLMDNVNRWELSVAKFNDLKNIMQSSITSTLWESGVVNQADLQTISSLLWQGRTPAEIVAQMQSMSKFTPEVETEAPKITKIWEKETIYNPITKQFEEVTVKWVWEQNLTDFIKWEEWFRSEAYLDIWWVPTVWYWFTSIGWVPVKLWDTITQEESEAELQNQIDRHSTYQGLVTVPLSDNQKSALASFEYNLGPSIWNDTATGALDVINMVNEWDLVWAWNLMKQFNKAAWEFSQGLQNRRNKEANLLLSDAWIDKGFSQLAQDWGQQILAWDQKISDLTWKENVPLKNEVTSYLAAKAKTTQNSNIIQINDSVNLVDTLLNHPGLSDVVWLPNMFTSPFWFTIPWTEAAWFRAKLEQLTASNFMTWIKWMKWLWSLSDAEWRKVAASVSSIAEIWQTEEEFIKELNRLKGILESRLTSTEKETGIQYDKEWFAIEPGTKPKVDTTWDSTWRWQSNTWNVTWRWAPGW